MGKINQKQGKSPKSGHGWQLAKGVYGSLSIRAGEKQEAKLFSLGGHLKPVTLKPVSRIFPYFPRFRVRIFCPGHSAEMCRRIFVV